MNTFKRFISVIPPWAFVLVLVVIFVQTANMFYLDRVPVSGEREKWYDGHYIIDYIKSNGPVDKAGIQLGDTIVSCNGYSLEDWFSSDHGQKAGDTLIFGILRNQVEVGYPVIVNSSLSMYPGIYWPTYLLFVLVSLGGLYILYKKSKDKAAKLYFIYIQQFVVVSSGQYYQYPEVIALFIALAFLFSASMLPATLFHFHLVFPQPAKFFSHYKKLPFYIYGAGLIIVLFQTSCLIFQLYFGSVFEPFPVDYIHIGLWWMTITSFLAIALAIFQLVTIKDTLARNQLRIIVIGTFFGNLFPIFFTFFYDYINDLGIIYPNLSPFSMKAGGLILITCLLIAIFRFRIWNIEVILKKALLYLGATTIIICTYLLLLYLVELMTIDETNISRFVTLAVSVMVFLVSRDRLQHFVEKIFHRETYDSASVISEFEEKLAGVFRNEDLGSSILEGMDEIFHFKSFIIFLKKKGKRYEPVFILGAGNNEINGETEITREMEGKLISSTVFSPAELGQIPRGLESNYGELIIPLVKDHEPVGFFLCGPKKSEKTYSMQDIRVLSLIAKRVIALFHTASLYQKDLDRQLMLEKERARISQDMHDDIGAGLTKIAMMSERVNSGTWNLEPGTRNSEKMLKIASTARDMINRLNVIVWALNPRYDNLDSLVSYSRRYFGEFLDNFAINFSMKIVGEIPDLPVTPDFRRNVFYACQEAVHNSVKHGECSEIIFEVQINSRMLKITITDNGKGFDQIKPGSGGNGLLNMKKRAEEMGGAFKIGSEAGKGTRVRFGIPV